MKPQTINAETLPARTGLSTARHEPLLRASVLKSPWTWAAVLAILLIGYSWGISENHSGSALNESSVNGFFDVLELVLFRASLLAFAAVGAVALFKVHIRGHRAAISNDENTEAMRDLLTQNARLVEVVTSLVRETAASARPAEWAALPTVSLSPPASSPSKPVTILTTVRAMHVPPGSSASAVPSGKPATKSSPKTIDNPVPRRAAATPAGHVTSAPLPPKRKFSSEEVRRLAYAKWEARGRRPGNPDRDWLEAERELLAKTP